MKKIEGTSREEIKFRCLEEYVEKDEEVRIIDEIVEGIDLKEAGFKIAERESDVGRPGYEEKKLLKLYLYGYRYGIHSGQKLEDACKYDTRVQWLLEENHPKRTAINDFRKNNKEALSNLLYVINRQLKEMNILKIKKVSQDGFKIKASNNKDRNYTMTKLLDRIKREEKSIEQYEEMLKTYQERKNEIKKALKEEKAELEELEELSKLEERIEEDQAELSEIVKRKREHERLVEEMIKSGESQISLTDPDSKLMRNNGKYEVAYNNQTAVDMESHITVAYETNNHPGDANEMSALMRRIKEEYGEEVITNVTDGGYQSPMDMMECLELGVIPQVTPTDRRKEKEKLQTEYEEAKISEEMRKSEKGEDIKKCLKAGVVPECYKEVIEKIEVVEKTVWVDEKGNEEVENRSSEEIRTEAMKYQRFEKDEKLGVVYCPMGEPLGKKSQRRDGTIRYANKLACANCKNPCTRSSYKEVEMKAGKNRIYPKGREIKSNKNKRTKKVVKMVNIELKIDKELLKKRMQTSEHTQGTLKTVGNQSSFSMRGKEKVRAEISLCLTASNIRRVCNMIGIEEFGRRLREYKEKTREVLSSVSKAYLNLNKWLEKIVKKWLICYN